MANEYFISINVHYSYLRLSTGLGWGHLHDFHAHGSGLRTRGQVIYILGKIFEQQGNTSKAIEHYEKCLDLWKDADPDNAEVEAFFGILYGFARCYSISFFEYFFSNS